MWILFLNSRYISIIQLPYIGKSTENMMKELQELMGDYYHHINPNFYFRCQPKIKSFFPLKDRTPVKMESGMVYKYTCDCSQSYIVVLPQTSISESVNIEEYRTSQEFLQNPLPTPQSGIIACHQAATIR